MPWEKCISKFRTPVPIQVRITDLKSSNGTFVKVGRDWEEIKGSRIVALDAELMLGDFRITPRKLLAAAPAEPPKQEAAPNESLPPAKKRSGPRRNEFGEIVTE